ncbi:peptidase MA family metallohydrolase [Gordonia neofelifaecis]|uniref:Peptidase MA-like domain-containing protein n=1 Tax=Gordonia neofelifaecis NRRL B-59395 TaxID=644548 RepID=F1YHJ1_9ACTN|nr:hypothetical protein [Gordonia neofelifaecis]EGD55829.1 hypothetical protein SCNU_06295 [Gordonia neofelifaecis NRRL B-59395]
MRTDRGAAAVSISMIAALAVTLAGCGADSENASAPSSSAAATTPLNPFEQQRYDGVTALLDQLSSTLSSGDRGGLDALVDPAATAAFRRHLDSIAADFAAAPHKSPLKLKEFRYRVAPQTGPEHLLEPDFEAKLEAAGATDSWVTPVDLDYALGGASAPGLDEPTVTLHQSLTFARYGDDWKVVGDGGLAPDPSQAELENPKAPDIGPWAFPGLEATDSRTSGGTSTVLDYRGAERTAADVAQILPGAVDAVSEFWGDDWVRRAAVIATADDAQFAGLTRTAPGDTSAAAAATVFTKIDRQNQQVIGQRIVLTPSARQLSKPALAVILRHELTHVASRLSTAQNAPLWLTEGVPEYVGRKGTYRDLVDAAPELAAAVAAGDVPKALPSDGAFSVSTDAARVAYQAAWSFAAYVAGKYGEEKLKKMYVEVGKGGDTETTDAAMKDALGVDKSKVVADWQAWLRAQTRR